MTKVVLLNSCFISGRKDCIQNTEPHIRSGIASIASFLKENKIEVEVLDPQIRKMGLIDIVEEIVSLKPDYLGLPAYTEEIYDADSIAKEVKRYSPFTTIIIGGHHVSAIPEDTLKEFSSFEIVVVGEGELTFRDIVLGRNLESVNGIVYRGKNGNIISRPPQEFVDLEKLPFPKWDFYNSKEYSFLPVDTLRGCPYPCIFCFKATSNKVRYKSPGRIVNEIIDGYNNFGFKRFILTGGGTFPLDKSHGIAVCKEIIKKCPQIKWTTSTRVDVLDEELLLMMKNSGCEEIALGVESGSSDILRSCLKGTTLKQIEDILRFCKKLGINTELNFILGLPHETKETIFDTKGFALRMAKYAAKANFAILTPFPGTKVYEMALNKQEGLNIRTKDWTKYGKQSGLAIEHHNFKEKELEAWQLKCYFAFYLRSPLKLIKIFTFKRVLGLIKKLFLFKYII